MTSLSHLFNSYIPCAGNEKIRIADGSLSPVTGKGLIKLSDSIDLQYSMFLNLPAIFYLLVNSTKTLTVVLSFLTSITFFRPKTRGRRLAVLEK